MELSRSVAKADVAELTAALDSAVSEEKAHHLIVVATNKVLSTTQFKQLFYSRGDDFFQIANSYECPDSKDSVYSSVWGIDCQDPWAVTLPNAAGLVEMGTRLKNTGRLNTGNVDQSETSIQTQECYNFNKLGGRENDPSGVAWAYSYAHDQNRNFYAQHEVMGYLEKDTCVKRDFWTACSRMSIEDQLYGLAFASETDQDLCMEVTCARRWSEVEDALAESCTAADRTIINVQFTFVITDLETVTSGGNVIGNGQTIVLSHSAQDGGAAVFTYTAVGGKSQQELVDEINLGTGVTTVPAGWSVVCAVGSTGNTISFVLQGLASSPSQALVISGTGTAGGNGGQDATSRAPVLKDGGHVDLFINVRVSNGHPKALDTILRVRFTVAYAFHEPSALNTWNIRSSVAAAGVIQSGVVGDAPEGGKEQAEDTTVVVP